MDARDGRNGAKGTRHTRETKILGEFYHKKTVNKKRVEEGIHKQLSTEKILPLKQLLQMNEKQREHRADTRR